MPKAFTEKEVEIFFQSQSNKYDLHVPIKLHDGTRSLGDIAQGEMALLGGALPMKPTGVFSPYQETILSFDGREVKPPILSSKPMFVVGFTAADAACLKFIDQFYQHKFIDVPYWSKRNNSVVVCVTGRCGNNGDFLPIAGGNCDLELIYDDETFITLFYTDIGKKIFNQFSGGVEFSEDKVIALKVESQRISSEEEKILQQASKLILENKVSDCFWQDISDSCIACTSCTLVCPTCTCFDIFDKRTIDDDKIDRIRLRDSCQLAGFMREARGHNPLGDEYLRTKQRICHKLAIDVKRFGHITCFNCGRCDQVCPSGIGIKSVCREIISEFN